MRRVAAAGVAELADGLDHGWIAAPGIVAGRGALVAQTEPGGDAGGDQVEGVGAAVGTGAGIGWLLGRVTSVEGAAGGAQSAVSDIAIPPPSAAGQPRRPRRNSPPASPI